MADQLAIVKDDGSIRPIDTLGTAAATAGAGIVAGTDNVIADLAASALLGRGSAGGTGDPEAITLGTNLSMSGTTLNATGGGGGSTPTGTGFVHVTGGVQDAAAALVTTADITANNVTFAKIQNISTDRLLGRDTASSGTIESLTVGGGIEFTGSGGIQTSALTGDVTKSAGGTATTIANDAVTTAKILDANVTLAKHANIATDRLLGRDTAASGVPEELTVGGGIEFTGSGGIQTSALTGDVTKSAGGTATTIATAAVTLAKMADIATDRLIGRDTAATGVPEALTVGGGIEFTGSGGIQRSALTGDVTASAGSGATTIAALAVATGMIQADAVSNAKLATMAGHTFKGNSTSSVANPQDMSATTATAELNAMVGDSGSGGTKGLVPAPAAGDAAAGKFLKADGTWAAGGSGAPTTVDYLVKTADAGLSAERVVTDTTTVVADWGTAGQVKFNVQALNTLTPPTGTVDCNTKIFNNIIPVCAAGTSSASSWPKLTAGTVLTTPEAGALEMETNQLYATGTASNRGVWVTEHFIRQAASRTLTSTTNVQKIFDSVTNGALTLPTGVYFFEMLCGFTGLSNTSGNGQVDILGAGTATVTTWLWNASGQDASTGTSGTQSGCTMASNASPGDLNTAAAATSWNFNARGTFEVTGTGTIIPSIALTTAAAGTVRAGCYFKCHRVGATSATAVGNWS